MINLYIWQRSACPGGFLAKMRSVLIAAVVVIVPTMMAQGQGQKSEGWSVAVGGGTFWAPAFQGSSDYQLLAVPALRVNYADRFFASVENGVGYNVILAEGWTVGPLVKFDFGRDSDGKSPFRIAGDRSTALRGFQDIDSTVLAGAFAGYRFGPWSAKVELLKGVNGHEGALGEVSLDYVVRLGGTDGENTVPVLFSTGPRLRWADDRYTQTYFGVTPADAAATGLRSYRADGGLTAVGWGAGMIRPLNRQLTLTALARYERLQSDAADSPLVRQHGSKDQFFIGVFVTYQL